MSRGASGPVTGRLRAARHVGPASPRPAPRPISGWYAVLIVGGGGDGLGVMAGLVRKAGKHVVCDFHYHLRQDAAPSRVPETVLTLGVLPRRLTWER